MTGLPEFRCIRYNEDKLNPGAGCGDCYDTHAGLGKPVLKCDEVRRRGLCRYGYESPYSNGGMKV